MAFKHKDRISDHRVVFILLTTPPFLLKWNELFLRNKAGYTSENNTGQMDGRTDGPTDGHDLIQRCDGASKKRKRNKKKEKKVRYQGYYEMNIIPSFF